MGDEYLEKNIDSAIGNVEIEGHNVSQVEKDLILKTFKKYKNRLGDQAIDSLLYGLVEELKYEEQKNAKAK
mgnify:CR=1 FL=1